MKPTEPEWWRWVVSVLGDAIVVALFAVLFGYASFEVAKTEEMFETSHRLNAEWAADRAQAVRDQALRDEILERSGQSPYEIRRMQAWSEYYQRHLYLNEVYWPWPVYDKQAWPPDEP